MDIVIPLTFTEAWEQLNATEQRLELLARHAENYPESDEIVAAMGRLISARDKIREAMGLVERGLAEALIASVAYPLADIPLAALPVTFDADGRSYDVVPEALDVYWNRGA